jgi:polyphosphate kinase
MLPPDTDAHELHVDLNNPDYYINRELSHLQFHARVLEQAKDTSIPLLERLKFLLIFSNNLDEFFEIRVAGLKRKIRLGQSLKTHDGLTYPEILNRINTFCQKKVSEQYQILNNQLFPALLNEKIRFIRRADWSAEQAAWVQRYFIEQVLPVISPIGLDPSHPFPKTSNKHLNFIVSLHGVDSFQRKSGLAIIPAPRSLPRLIRLPDQICDPGVNFVFLSSVIHANIGILFPGMQVKGCYQFRVTRNADLKLDEERIEDLAMALKGELLSRKYGDEVRLEVADSCPAPMIDFLLKQFQLEKIDLYKLNGIVNLSRMFEVTTLDIPHLKYPLFHPKLPKKIQQQKDIFEILRQKDLLLHHPFDSFFTVIDFLKQAARDPAVLAIKQTLYRTGSESEITDLLVEAAKNGKEVTAIIELRARFDEATNLEAAKRLQAVGATVVYGIVGYKIHAKMILIIRQEKNKIQRYLHIGTGNYHIKNANIYTDISLLTANQKIGEDAQHIFQQITGMGSLGQLQQLLYSPFTLHPFLKSQIEHERQQALLGKKARIIIKVNGLTEPKLIQALYSASQAGVEIDLIVRGICCLRPGIPGISERIKVRSIVGRFLEHARLYFFQNGQEPRLFASSADWMERNMFQRIETCFEISDPELKIKAFSEGLLSYLLDNTQAWLLQPDGQYIKASTIEGHQPYCAQSALIESRTNH